MNIAIWDINLAARKRGHCLALGILKSTELLQFWIVIIIIIVCHAGDDDDDDDDDPDDPDDDDPWYIHS